MYIYIDRTIQWLRKFMKLQCQENGRWYLQDLIPEEPVDPNYRLEVDPVFQHVYKQSLAPYFER